MVTQYHTLKEEDRGVDPDGLMRVQMIVRTKRSCCTHAKLDGGMKHQSAEYLRMTDDGMMNLSAAVAATCPTRLTQPVIQAAKGAPRGLEIMAAQK